MLHPKSLFFKDHGITQSLRSEGTCQDHLVQPPCSSRVSQSRLPRTILPRTMSSCQPCLFLSSFERSLYCSQLNPCSKSDSTSMTVAELGEMKAANYTILPIKGLINFACSRLQVDKVASKLRSH